MTHLIINELMNELDRVALHLCFNITVKGQTIVPDWSIEIFNIPENTLKTMFSNEIECKSDSILSSNGFKVIFSKFDLLQFPEVAINMLILEQC